MTLNGGGTGTVHNVNSQTKTDARGRMRDDDDLTYVLTVMLL